MISRRALARSIAALAVAALIVGALAAQAGAERHIRIDSQVTLASSNPFHGKVNSKPYSHTCREQRTVEVFNKQAGPDGLFDKTTTDLKGRWKIPATPNGKFYAVVKRQAQGAAGTIFICRKAKSPVVNF
jgi:hypothetical protein